MRAPDFRALLDSLSGLTARQRAALCNALEHGDSDAVRDLLEELLIDGANCPHCGAERVIRWGQAIGLPRWRCKSAGELSARSQERLWPAFGTAAGGQSMLRLFATVRP